MNIIYRIRLIVLLFLLFTCTCTTQAQNSLIGDGFGGRSWYVAHNYQVGAYTGFTVCGPNDQLYAWGGNFHGELGIGTLVSTTLPVAVPGMTNVRFYTTGYLSCVIKNDNTAWVWGSLPGVNTSIVPNPVQMLTNVKFADGGISHAVFVKNDGTVWGMGKNLGGELGIGTISPSNFLFVPPVQMTGVTNAVRAVAIGSQSDATPASMILLADSTVMVTGGNPYFSQATSNIPEILPGLNKIIDIKACAVAAYALNSSGEVYAFGRKNNFRAALGLGILPPTPTYALPTKVIFPAGAAPIVALSSNNDGFSALALDENGNVYGWGDNGNGQLGDGTFIRKDSPALLATHVVDIFAGETFSYILKDDNTIWATGSSGYNILMYGSIWMNLPNITRNVFTQINPIGEPMNLCPPKAYGTVCTATVKLGNDTTVCEGEKLVLNAALPNASYLWQDNSTNATYTVTKAGTYWVKATYGGCQKADTIVVATRDCYCTPNIPNAFSPNGDGIHDQWVITKPNCVQQVDVLVYNRYGSLVYERKNYQSDWEGTYGSKALPDATYYYIIKVRTVAGKEVQLKGNVTILRG